MLSDEITTSEHRAAWDATISAPKSVSLAALVGGDDRIRDAHRESVNEALKEFEKYLPQARGGGPPSRHHKPKLGMNLIRGSTGEFCALKMGKVQPRITTPKRSRMRGQKRNQTASTTISLMTLGV